MDNDHVLQVSEAIKLINQTFVLTLPRIAVEGEVSGFRVSQGKWVFFDLKDEEASLRCFTTVRQQSIELEDGMKVKLTARPNLHNKYGFSLVVENMMASGEGSLKKAFELSKKKLAAEGLFDEDKKRQLPEFPMHIGLITSSEAAAYTDITRILGERWPLAELIHAEARVQGVDAPASLIEAVEAMNKHSETDVLIIARGGGSLEDLAAFNDEQLVRSIAASRIPTIVGVGHERDVTLAELAADRRATTPTNAAQVVAPDREVIRDRVMNAPYEIIRAYNQHIETYEADLKYSVNRISSVFDRLSDRIEAAGRRLQAFNPAKVLARGYTLTKLESGQILKSAKQVTAGDILITKFNDGDVKSEATK